MQQHVVHTSIEEADENKMANAATATTTRRLCLSLTGSGHLLVYQLGACRTLQLQQDESITIDHVVGASGGAIAAAVMAADISIDDYAQAFIRQRGNGMNLLQEFWSHTRTTSSPNTSRNTDKKASVGLHIATTRCQDGSSKVFSFNTLEDPERIFQCIRASCLIPPTFHPLDIVSSPSPYPDREGLAIDDPVEGVDFYVDGGIATPAPMFDDSLVASSDTALLERVIISPVAGTSQYAAARISPRGGWPRFQIQVCHDMGMELSWNNLRTLQAASGNVTSNELQRWFDRGQDDAGRFLDAFLAGK